MHKYIANAPWPAKDPFILVTVHGPLTFGIGALIMSIEACKIFIWVSLMDDHVSYYYIKPPYGG